MSSGLENHDEIQDEIEQGPTRYAAFAMRIRTLAIASSRYIAYTSDVGESIRPLTSPNIVRFAYGISWAYILGDCGYAGYLANKERQGVLPNVEEKIIETLSPIQKVELRKRQIESNNNNNNHTNQLIKYNPLEVSSTTHIGLVVARRAIFQSIASMALPAFTIHSVVRYSAPIFKRASNKRIQSFGPTIAGLAVVPALPFLFDKPVEHGVDFIFDNIEQGIASSMAKNKEEFNKKIK